MTPKIAFYVGHENWGKSETLYHLVGRSRHKAWIEIDNISIFVRHMSNDDLPESFIDFIDKVNADSKPSVVAALCPNFVNPAAKTESLLRTLKRKSYELYFWIMLHQYGTSNMITSAEIDRLRESGVVTIYRDKSEAGERAKAFKTYLSNIFKG
jgi:hypothetical protein